MEYTEMQGDIVRIGDMVGFSEHFPEYGDKAYVVVGLPNLGDMVEIKEITDISHDSTTDEWTYAFVDENVVMTVEPYKMGLI